VLKNKYIYFTKAILFVLCFHCISDVYSEILPQDFGYSSQVDALVDAGFIWGSNSLIHPIDYSLKRREAASSYGAFTWLKYILDEYITLAEDAPSSKQNDRLSMLFIPGLGANLQRGKASIYDDPAFYTIIWWQAKYRDNWYSRIYFRGTNEEKSLPHYTGTSEDIEGIGLDSGEFDQALIGYKNDWVNIEYGRTREIWGSMSEDNMILSGHAPALDRFMLQLHKKRLTFRYFFGFLETHFDEMDIQRYIAGRLVEYNNHKNLIIGISETSVFAGPNRSIDMAFLNPLGFHIEIDLNDRSNNIENRDNGIWGIYFDWLARSNLRLTGMIAADEYQIGQEERNEGIADWLGYFVRIAWTPKCEPVGITLLAEAERLDTNFGRHNYGYANLVSRGVFLGHPIGNDADRISMGIRTVFPFRVMVKIELGKYRWGDGSLIYNPYEPYETVYGVPFPSGQVRTNNFLGISIDAQPIRNFSVNISGHVDLHNSGEDSALESWTINLYYTLPYKWEY